MTFIPSVSITTNPGGKNLSVGIKKFSEQLNKIEIDSLKTFTDITKITAKSNLSDCRRTGELEDSIGDPNRNGILRISIKNLFAEMGTRVGYAPHVNYSTRPHIILPRNKKSLKFKDKSGKIIFRGGVRHPGSNSKCRFYMDKALDSGVIKVRSVLKRKIKIL